MHAITHLLRRTLATGTAAAVAAVLVTGAPAQAERTRVVTSNEDCHEVIVPRAVSTSGLRALVPDRYDLVTLSATASRAYVITLTCESVRVEPGGDSSPARRTTITLGGADLSARDGATTDDIYLLWYGTDNPEEAAKLRQLGLPVTFQPLTSVSVSKDGATNTLAWDVRGGGIDYRIDAIGIEPSATVGTSGVTWLHDGPEGTVRMAFDNRVRPASTALVSADFSQLEPLVPILASPVRPTGVRFGYIRGDWTLTAEVVG